MARTAPCLCRSRQGPLLPFLPQVCQARVGCGDAVGMLARRRPGWRKAACRGQQPRRRLPTPAAPPPPRRVIQPQAVGAWQLAAVYALVWLGAYLGTYLGGAYVGETNTYLTSAGLPTYPDSMYWRVSGGSHWGGHWIPPPEAGWGSGCRARLHAAEGAATASAARLRSGLPAARPATTTARAGPAADWHDLVLHSGGHGSWLALPPGCAARQPVEVGGRLPHVHVHDSLTGTPRKAPQTPAIALCPATAPDRLLRPYLCCAATGAPPRAPGTPRRCFPWCRPAPPAATASAAAWWVGARGGCGNVSMRSCSAALLGPRPVVA